MSEHIEFSCGCQVNEYYVLGMCRVHAHELTQKRVEAKKRVDEYHRQMRESISNAFNGEAPR